jgi:hypothetical protein
MKFAAKRDPLLAQLGFFSRQISFKIEKTIVGISQYAYFN